VKKSHYALEKERRVAYRCCTQARPCAPQNTTKAHTPMACCFAVALFWDELVVLRTRL